MATVSAVVLIHNEVGHLTPCLESLAWADERLVLHSGGNDEIVKLALAQGAREESRAFVSFPDLRNAALEMARGDWVFFLDADERATPEVAAEVRQVAGDSEPAAPVLWWIPRHNVIFGKVIHHTGWYPDHQARLLRVGRARFDPARVVHELPVADGAQGYLKNAITHYNYRTVNDFLAKQSRYAEMEAVRLRDQGIRPRFWAPVVQPLRQFRWRYVTLQGYRDGGHGLLLSALMAYYDHLVYRRLRALTGGLSAGSKGAQTGV